MFTKRSYICTITNMNNNQKQYKCNAMKKLTKAENRTIFREKKIHNCLKTLQYATYKL